MINLIIHIILLHLYKQSSHSEVVITSSLRDQIKNDKLPDFLKSHAVLDENDSNAKILKGVLGIDVYRY